MVVSSRTPEGLPNRCPLCHAEVRVEPSVLFGDAPCPGCGSLLWFMNVESTTYLHEHCASRGIRERVMTLVAGLLGVDHARITENASLVNDLGADSLDTVELVMELEEECDRR